MATGNSTIAMDIARRRLRAIEVSRSGGNLRVRRVLVETVPEHLDLDDALAVGTWIGEQMKRAGFSRGRVTFAIAREHVSLKRMTLPTEDRYELPEMVRLSMRRELPFDPSEAVIDYIPVSARDGHTTVLVAAIRRQLVDLVARTAKAAGLKVDRISLRCMGAAALLRSLSREVNDSAAWLSIDITGEGVELSVLTDGSIRFSRAAEVTHLDDSSEFADAVVTETRRSWMSYRIVEDAPEINCAYLFGEIAIAKVAAVAVEELMNVRTEVIEGHPRIDEDGLALRSTWPLAGLLLEPVIAADSFDFARPRKAPDRHALKRQLAMAAAGVLFLLAIAGLMFARKDLQARQAVLNDLEDRISENAADFFAYERDHWRLQHLERWDDAQVAWLDHLAALQDHLPGSQSVVLDQWSGVLRNASVQYDDRASGEKKWSVPAEVAISLDGEARSQSIADAVRQSFVQTKEYIASPMGPDTQGGKRYQFPFKLSLRARERSPARQEEPAEEAAAAAENDQSSAATAPTTPAEGGESSS